MLNNELFAFGGLYVQIKVMLQFWFSVTLTARISSVTGVSQVDNDSEFLTAIRTPIPILSPGLSILCIVYPCGISSLFETLDVSHVSVMAKTSQSALYTRFWRSLTLFTDCFTVLTLLAFRSTTDKSLPCFTWDVFV